MEREKERLKQVRKARRSSYLSTAVSPFLTIMLSTAAQGKSTLCPAGRQEGRRQHRLRSTAASHWFEQQAPCTNSIMSIPARAAHSPEAFRSRSPTPWCWRLPGNQAARHGIFFLFPLFLWMGGFLFFLSFFPLSSCWVLFLSLFSASPPFPLRCPSLPPLPPPGTTLHLLSVAFGRVRSVCDSRAARTPSSEEASALASEGGGAAKAEAGRAAAAAIAAAAAAAAEAARGAAVAARGPRLVRVAKRPFP